MKDNLFFVEITKSTVTMFPTTSKVQAKVSSLYDDHIEDLFSIEHELK